MDICMWLWAHLRRYSAIDYRRVFQTELVKENTVSIFWTVYVSPSLAVNETNKRTQTARMFTINFA